MALSLCDDPAMTRSEVAAALGILPVDGGWLEAIAIRCVNSNSSMIGNQPPYGPKGLAMLAASMAAAPAIRLGCELAFAAIMPGSG